MSDEQQKETGADVNALRNNIPVGESREYRVAAITNKASVIAAFVTETDVDVDEFVMDDAASPKPMKGDLCIFARESEDGPLVVTIKERPKQ